MFLSSCCTPPKENVQQAVQSDYTQAYCSFLTLKPADAGDRAKTREMLMTSVFLSLDNVRSCCVEGMTSLTPNERRDCSTLASQVLDYMLLHKGDWDSRRLDVQAGLRGLRYFLTTPKDVHRLDDLTDYLAAAAKKKSEHQKP